MVTAPNLNPLVSIMNDDRTAIALRSIVQGLSAQYGKDFFPSLANALCRALDAAFVFIGEIDERFATHVQTVGASHNGQTMDNFVYSLSCTPCDIVRKTAETVYIAQNAALRFPDDAFLAEQQVESYIGIALLDSRGEVIGVLAVMYNAAIQDSEFVISVMKMFSTRIAAELERERIEAVRNEQDWILAESQRVAQLGSYDFTVATGTWVATPVLEHLFGIPPTYNKNVEGWANCVYEDDRAHMLRYFKDEVLGNKQEFNKVYRIKRQNDGAVRWVHGKGRLIFNAEGQPVRMVGTIQDITEYKHALEAIEQERINIETVISSISDGVVVVNAQQQIIRMNAVAELLSGFTEQEALGKQYFGVVVLSQDTHGNDEHVADFVEFVLSTRTSLDLSHKIKMRRKDGVMTPVALSASPVIRSDGLLVGAVCIIRNMSKEREFEKQKDEFFSFAAHQLRSPLTSIRWSLESLIDEKESFAEQTAEVVMTMYDTIIGALDVLNDFLETSRIDQGFSGQTAKELLHIDSVVKEIIMYIKPIAEKKNVTLQTSLEHKEGDSILIDGKKFRYIISNLIDNAIKYTNSGGKVDFILSLVDNKLYISVSDTGIGIPLDEQPHIFSKFFRAPNAFTQQHTGSGLGLYVVKSYVDQLGGTITFTSVPEQGTTFNLTIPVA